MSLGSARTLALGCAIASVALRILYLREPGRIDATLPPAFAAAEGVVGLMAHHIVAGARPIFHYGQFYNSAFEAYLTAPVLWALGTSMRNVRLVATLFAVAWIPLGALVAGRLFGARAGWIAAALIALPSPFVFEWGFVAWGGYSHVALTLLAVLLLVGALPAGGRPRAAALGAVLGVSLWANQLVLAYLPVVAYVVAKWLRPARAHAGALLVALLIGAAPLVYGNVVEPLATARNLGFKVKQAWQRSADADAPEERPSRYYQAVPLAQILGVQPRPDGRWSLAGTAAALALVGAAVLAVRRVYAGRDLLAARRTAIVIAFVGFGLGLGIPGFFGQPVGRYQIVVYPLLCVLAAGWLAAARPPAAFALLGLIVAVQAGQLLTAAPAAAGIGRRALVDALVRHDLQAGYGADYFYDLVVEAREQIIVEPLGWSKYPPYGAVVERAERPFYLYRDDQQRKRSHGLFLEHLARSRTAHARLDVGEYHVLYDFTPPLGPAAVAALRAELLGRRAAP
jgi:4-amino-4-deoxy-L-arabinose transferase-like glycosyltransferase